MTYTCGPTVEPMLLMAVAETSQLAHSKAAHEGAEHDPTPYR